MEWKKFPSWPDWIGSDVSRYVTVARAGKTTITVAPGKPLLLIDATGASGVPVIHLRAPNGRTYVSTRRRSDAIPVSDPTNNNAGLTILAPDPGRWTVTQVDGAGSTRVRAQTVRRITRVTPRRITTRSSRRRRLARKGSAIRIRWTSAGLPAGTKVSVYVSQSPRDLGTAVATGRRARGSYALRRRALASGVNYVHLLVVRHGVTLDRRNVPGGIWMK
jgi:hypothetical protein